MFRAITKTDFDTVYKIYTSDSVNPFMNWDKVSKKDFEECFEVLLARDEFLAFEKNDEIVGLITIVRGRWRVCHIASLQSFAVSPKYQNLGIGNEMISLLVNRLRNEGIRRLELIVESDNLRAIHLYEKLGFKKEGVLREYFRRSNNSKAINDYIMSKLL